MVNGKKICLYVDDDAVNRNPPEDGNRWVRAFNAHRALAALELFEYDIVSLDNDLASFYGNKELTGRDILSWMIEEHVTKGRFKNTLVRVHSANPDGRKTMQEDIDRFF